MKQWINPCMDKNMEKIKFFILHQNVLTLVENRNK